MGGGTSLHDDLAKCPDDAIKIAVNHHAPKYYKPDFVVCMDKPAISWIRQHTQAPIVSALKAADHQITDLKFHPINSGILAIWIAAQMGASQIYCCGMDFYRSQIDYVDGSPPVKQSNKVIGYGNRCKRLALQVAGDAELIRFSWW